MSEPRLLRGLALYAALLAVACWLLHRVVAIEPGAPLAVVASVWSHGQLVDRSVLPSTQAHDDRLDAALRLPDRELVHESVVGEGPIVTGSDFVFALSLVSGHDGVHATLGPREAYVTADDLLQRQAYDHGLASSGLGLSIGIDTAVVWALLSDRLGASASEVRAHARIRRARFVRSIPGRPPAPASLTTAESLTTEVVRGALLDAARYLARGMRDDGHFRYLVDAPTNRTLPGYDWPRHAGATYFLAQAAALSHEPELAMACLRAAALMRDRAMSDCGGAPCVGNDARVDLGSSALALVAFAEIVRTGLDTSYRAEVVDLARFLRAQQRADGEFMHEYDRSARRPIDVQYLYYSGEATLALSRAHSVTADGADLEAARRGLAHLVGPAWSFFGDRYYFGEEHWTCQALADLWDRAPDPKALDFCVRWQAFGRRVQQHAGESAFDADGAFGVGPVVTPRLTPVASRCEAGVATLDVLRRTGGRTEELEMQLRRSMALLVRQQLRPGPSHLFADPGAVLGAMPGSEVDLELRIDYAQHMGSALVRWLELAGGAG